MVYLDEDRIRRSSIYAFLKELHVGNEQIISDQLHLVPKFFRQCLPVFPITFRASVFNAHDRILAAQPHIKRNQLLPGQFLAAALLERVGAAAIVKFAARHIQREVNLASRFVTRIGNSLQNRLNGILDAFELRRKAAFVTHRCAHSTVFQNRL